MLLMIKSDDYCVPLLFAVLVVLIESLVVSRFSRRHGLGVRTKDRLKNHYTCVHVYLHNKMPPKK